MSAGLLLPCVPLRLQRERESQRLLSLLDCDLRKRLFPFFVVYIPDSSSRGRGLDTWLVAKTNCVGVSRMDFYSSLALALSQLWRSRFDTQAKPGRSSLAFTLQLLGRFFQHLCGRSHYASLRECLTALLRARRSRGCMIRSIRFAQASLE